MVRRLVTTPHPLLPCLGRSGRGSRRTEDLCRPALLNRCPLPHGRFRLWDGGPFRDPRSCGSADLHGPRWPFSCSRWCSAPPRRLTPVSSRRATSVLCRERCNRPRNSPRRMCSTDLSRRQAAPSPIPGPPEPLLPPYADSRTRASSPTRRSPSHPSSLGTSEPRTAGGRMAAVPRRLSCAGG